MVIPAIAVCLGLPLAFVPLQTWGISIPDMILHSMNQERTSFEGEGKGEALGVCPNGIVKHAIS